MVRYITQEDAKQSPKASKLIEPMDGDNTGYITLVCAIALYWLLASCYELTGEQVMRTLKAILRIKQRIVKQADQAMLALQVFSREKGKADFADCLIERSASSAGCTQTMTFDVGAIIHPQYPVVGTCAGFAGWKLVRQLALLGYCY